MKFAFAQSEQSKTWMNPRYIVQVQHTRPSSTDFVVFVGANDSGDQQEYTPLYPRFETQGKTIQEGAYNAGGIAEALVREMRKLPEDAPLSKVQKILNAIKELIERNMGGSQKPQILMPGKDF